MNFKETLHEYAAIRINRNYSKLEHFYSYELTHLSALRSLRWEILSSLLLENNNASITLTNHFVERMLKLSLIVFETKNINLSEPEKYSKRIKHFHNQYDHLNLDATIRHNKKKKLISEQEAIYLNTICKTFRDSYSHAQIKTINKDHPDIFLGNMFSLDDIKNKLEKGDLQFNSTKIELPKESPIMAELYQTESARENALNYFAEIQNILMNIEKNIEEN